MKSREAKRQEAEDRKVIYGTLTPKQKIEKLNKRGVRALKERKRLGFPEVPVDCVK